MFRRLTVLRSASSAVAVALGISDATQKRLAELIESSKKKAAASHSVSTLTAAPGRGFEAEVAHIHKCNSEITKLFKMPEVKALIGLDGTTPALSSAELIHRTAFSPSATVHGRNDEHVHDAGCSIKSGQQSMSTILFEVKKDEAAPPPCKHCLRRRLNFLASEHFAHNLHWNSIMPNVNSANHINNQKVYQLVRESFGTMRALEDTLAEFAVNRRDSGFTWLVYNPLANSGSAANPSTTPKSSSSSSPAAEASTPRGKLEVVNLPGSTSPVVLGMWPILCINLTTETIVDAMTYAEAAHAEQCSSNPLNVAHSWSRAARNPASAVTRQNTSPEVEMTLTDLRRVAATQQCRSLDIAFMEAQTQAALNYFSSAEYVKATEQRRQQLASEAQAKVVKAFDNVELETVNELKKATIDANAKAAAETTKKAAAAATTAGAKKDDAASGKESKAATDDKKTTTSNDAQTKAAAAAAAAATTNNNSEETSAPAAAAPEPDGDSIVAEGVCDDGETKYVTRYNGITTFSYTNGTSTDVYPDGRQVSYASDLTTTTYPDGTIHYLYANGATVEIRPDGKRYVNGELSNE